MTRRDSADAIENASVVPNYRRLCIASLGGLAAIALLATLVHEFAIQMTGILEITPNGMTEIYRSMQVHGVIAAVGTIGVLIARRRRRAGRRAARASVLVLTLGILISLDRVLGICYPPPSALESVLVPHATRGWAHRRGTLGSEAGVSAAINSLGMRGPEVNARKSRGEFRILFLGDSITFGYMQEYRDTYVTQTAERIRRIAPTVRITDMNAGVGGYSTWQELDYLEKEGLKLDPDLVILEFCFNDVAELVYLEPGKLSGHPMPFRFARKSHWSGFARAALSIQGRYQFEATLRELHFSNNLDVDAADRLGLLDERIFKDPAHPAAEDAWERTLGFLDRIRAACRDEDVPWILVAFPFQSQLRPEEPAILPQIRTRRWAEQRGVLYLDLLPAFRRQTTEFQRSPQTLMMDEVHLTAEGSRLAAGELVAFLSRNNLAPSKDPAE